MSKWLLAAAVSLASLSLSAGANASELFFQYTETGTGAIYFSFDQSSTPTPISFNPGVSSTVAVTDWTGNVGPGSPNAIQWNYYIYSGMFMTFVYDSVPYAEDYGDDGPQVYTGPEASPTFAPGTFVGYDYADGLPSVLTITDAVTPLPAALPLFATGLGALGLFGWRRKRKNAAAVATA